MTPYTDACDVQIEFSLFEQSDKATKQFGYCSLSPAAPERLQDTTEKRMSCDGPRGSATAAEA